MTDDIVLHNGAVLKNIHPEGACFGEFCPIHRPSDHPLNDKPFLWEPEIRVLFRVCEHEYSHPDPDDTRFLLAFGQFALVEAVSSVHLMKENCDGCCQRRD